MRPEGEEEEIIHTKLHQLKIAGVVNVEELHPKLVLGPGRDESGLLIMNNY